MTSERRCYTTHRESSGLDAFCQTCPTAEAVTTLLEGLGFSLSFQMDAMRYPAYTQLPDLPAQYHYSDEYGTQVIYMVGRDTPLDGERFPRHASRFWVYPGADAGAFRRVVSVLAIRWLLTWQRSPRPHAQADVA
jgi:hypothetical protein